MITIINIDEHYTNNIFVIEIPKINIIIKKEKITFILRIIGLVNIENSKKKRYYSKLNISNYILIWIKQSKIESKSLR